MHIEISGQGPALVLVHGWAMHGGIFAPLVARLRDHCTLHVVDLPGHGASGTLDWLALDDCARAIAARVPDDAAWLGWSLGGMVALRSARLGLTSGLVMLCATPRFPSAPDWPHGVAPEVLTRFGSELAADVRATIERFLALEAMGSDHMREDLRALRAHVFERGEPSREALRHGLDLLLTGDLREDLEPLDTPSLWIAGRRDRLVLAAAMREAAARCTDALFVQIEGGGHAPFLSHGDEVAGAILEFLAARTTAA
jgi:pimeloyl-[acyl-carrier protein] methyl ester esterase